MTDTTGCPCTYSDRCTNHPDQPHCCYAAPDLPKAPAPLPCGHDDSSQWAEHLRTVDDD